MIEKWEGRTTRIARPDRRRGPRGSDCESIPDCAADDSTTKDTKVTKEDTDNKGAETGSRDAVSASKWSRRGIPCVRFCLSFSAFVLFVVPLLPSRRRR